MSDENANKVSGDDVQADSDATKAASFKPAFICFGLAVAVHLIGSFWAESIKKSASGGFFQVGSTLQGAANIEGTTAVLELIIVLVGVVLLVKAFKKRKQETPS